MSDYTIAVSWSGKDALSDSDTAKIISGDDFNTEFTAVQTAVNTKANVNGSVTEDFSATTAPVATNSTRVATTAYVLNSVYPVGSVYIAVISTNPSTLFGGTWSAFGTGRTLIGIDSGDSDFNSVEETGGAKTHSSAVPSHTHTYKDVYLAEQGSGSTVWSGGGTIDSGQTNMYGGGSSDSDNQYGYYRPATTDASGSGSTTHSNVPPYITVYMWKRTA